MTPTGRFVGPARRDLISRKRCAPDEVARQSDQRALLWRAEPQQVAGTDSGNSVEKLRSPSISAFGKLHRPDPEEGMALSVVPALDRLAQGLLAVVLGAPVGREGRRL